MTELNEYLLNDELFAQFRSQLKKDFEGAGLNGKFADNIPRQLDELAMALVHELEPISGKPSLAALLYRVDISERQIREHQAQRQTLLFIEVLSELIIKRVLQKIILKRKFSGS
jgi:hypothetical protein